MPELMDLTSRVVEKIDSIHKSVSAKAWQDLSRTVFASSLGRAAAELEEIRAMLEIIRTGMEKEAIPEAPGIRELLAEFDSTLKTVRRNLALETGKQRVKGQNYEKMLGEKSEAPELYASLEQRVLALLLKTGFLMQRLQVQLNSVGAAQRQGGRESGLAVLARARENELIELKKKYEELKAKSYYSRVGEKGSADLEQVVSEIARKIEAEARMLSASVKAHERRFEELERGYSEVASHSRSLEELCLNYANKSSDLLTELKKERDYAKKMVLEIENETLQLRHAYSNELVKMQEARNELRRELLQEFSSRTGRLEKELEEKKDLLGHFRGMAESRERELSELEAKMKVLKAKLEFGQKKTEHSRHGKK